MILGTGRRRTSCSRRTGVPLRSSYFSGVSNIFRYDVGREVMEPLSNAETGLFKPLPSRGRRGRLGRVFRYSSRGFTPVLIANAVPDSVSAIRFSETRSPPHAPSAGVDAAASSRINLDSLTTRTGNYSTLGNFKLDNAYPVLEGSQNAAGADAWPAVSASISPIALAPTVST